MYKNSNVLQKKKLNEIKKKRVIKLKRLQLRRAKKEKFIFSLFAFSAFSVISGGFFFFLMGQAKLNELTYKISKNTDRKKDDRKNDIKNLDENQNAEPKVKTCATLDKAVIF